MLKPTRPSRPIDKPADFDARAGALDPAQSFIVQAPAGSGKTGLLVRRFLTLLASVDTPEQILAITFTRKATAEMRQRIIDALHGVDNHGNPETDAEIATLGEKALANARQHDWQLHQNSSRLKVQTIDSFCGELVRRMPWSAGFGAPPQLLEDATLMYLQAARLSMQHIEGNDKTRADACHAVLQLMNADLQLTLSLIATMLANRDQWMRLASTIDRAQSEHYWQQTIDDTLIACDALLDADWRSQLADLAPYAAKNTKIERAQKENEQGKKATPAEIEQCENMPDFPAADSRSVHYWRGFAGLLLTTEGSPRKRVDKRAGFPTTDKARKHHLLGLCAKLFDQPELLQAWQRIRHLPDGVISDAQWQTTAALCIVLKLAAAELRLLFRDQNIADYVELSQRANIALGEADNPSDLALAFDYRINHILMDEFQDTASGQIELLRKLLAGWQNGDGRTVFLVGDPMQSIYRFREAEVGIFLDVQRHGIVDDVVPQSLALQCNFRSAPALIDWFNHTFREVMPPKDDITYGAVKYNKVEYGPVSAHRPPEESAVAYMHAAIRREMDAEAEAIADVITTTLQAFPDATIAILGRTRRSLTPTVQQLEKRGIAYQGIKLQHLAERQAIQDLVALTLALLHPADRVAWMGLLRAPWVGASLQDCVNLVAAAPGEAVLSLLCKQQVMANLSPHFQQRAGLLATVMQQGYVDRANLPLHQNIRACWLRLGGPAVVDTADLNDCYRYINLIAKLEQNRTPVNRDNLEHALADLYADNALPAQVQILTVHAAKGLEFDTVILPGLHTTGRSEGKPLLRWKKLPDRLLMAPRPPSDAKQNRHYDFLGELNKEHQRNEASRLLYVACTRARKRLHLFASANDKMVGKQIALSEPPAGALLAILWAVVKPEFEQAFADYTPLPPDTQQATPTATAPISRLPANWTLPDIAAGITLDNRDQTTASERLVVEYQWAREIARISGIIIHRHFQAVDVMGWQACCQRGFSDKDRALWRHRLCQHGLPPAAIAEAAQLVERALQSAIDDPQAAWIFAATHQHIKTEWQLTGYVDGAVRHAIIDRSFVDGDNIRWVIDFKSSRHDDQRDLEQFIEQEKLRYQAIMNQYATMLGHLENRVVKKALYYPVLQQFVEL